MAAAVYKGAVNAAAEVASDNEKNDWKKFIFEKQKCRITCVNDH